MKITSAAFVKGVVGNDPILYTQRPQIAFVGRSNVGKSSVLSSLFGHGKGLVKTGKRPGKTTEMNFFLVNNAYHFVDLPGYGFAKMGQEGREKIREMIIGYLSNEEANIRRVALVLDAKAGLTDFDRDMLEILREEERATIIILNKTDKLNQKELSETLRAIEKETPPDVELFQYSALVPKRTRELGEKLIA